VIYESEISCVGVETQDGWATPRWAPTKPRRGCPIPASLPGWDLRSRRDNSA